MAKAIAKHIRMSPRKLRRVVNEIRGKNANSATILLKFMPYAAARVVEKVLKSAVSNAKENEKQNPDELKIVKAFVDQSVTLRRWRAMSRGRGFPILKKSSHVTIEVEPDGSLESVSAKDKKSLIGKKEKHDHRHDQHHDHDHSHEHHGHSHDHEPKLKEVKQTGKKNVKAKETKKDSSKKKKKKED